jgi:hypothetical protein
VLYGSCCYSRGIFLLVSFCCRLSLVFDLEDGSNMFLRNVWTIPHHIPQSILFNMKNSVIHFGVLWGFGSSRDRLRGLEVRFPGYRYRDPGFESWRYQIFWEVVGLERGPLSLVRITEELLEWKSSGSGSRKSRLTAVGIRYADHATPPIHKSLKLTSPTCGGLSVGILCLRTFGLSRDGENKD